MLSVGGDRSARLSCSKFFHLRFAALISWEVVGRRMAMVVNVDCGSPIEEKVADLEGCHVANRCV